MISKVLTIMFLAICIAAEAQTINPQTDNIRWNASGVTDLVNQLTSNKPFQFVTYAKTKIDWIQRNGALVYTLSVNSVDDISWTDASKDGSITYNVSLQNLTGTVTISRSANVTTIYLKLSGGSSHNADLQYPVTDFETL